MSLNVSPQYHSPRSPLRRRFPSSANTPHASRPVYWIYCFPWQGRCYVGFCPGAMLSNLSMGMARGKSLRRQHVNMVVSWNRHGEDQTNRDGVGLQRFHHIGPLTVGKGKKKRMARFGQARGRMAEVCMAQHVSRRFAMLAAGLCMVVPFCHLTMLVLAYPGSLTTQAPLSESKMDVETQYGIVPVGTEYGVCTRQLIRERSSAWFAGPCVAYVPMCLGGDA